MTLYLVLPFSSHSSEEHQDDGGQQHHHSSETDNLHPVIIRHCFSSPVGPRF